MSEVFVRCNGCSRWTPDNVNPPDGMGTCALGPHNWRGQTGPGGKRAAPPYPYALRQCAAYDARK